MRLARCRGSTSTRHRPFGFALVRALARVRLQIRPVESILLAAALLDISRDSVDRRF